MIDVSATRPRPRQRHRLKPAPVTENRLQAGWPPARHQALRGDTAGTLCVHPVVEPTTALCSIATALLRVIQ